MDSVCLEGEAGEIGGLNLAGVNDGVEGPRNDASRLMKSGRAFTYIELNRRLDERIVGCLSRLSVWLRPQSQTHFKNNFFKKASIFLQLQWLVNAKLGHT